MGVFASIIRWKDILTDMCVQVLSNFAPEQFGTSFLPIFDLVLEINPSIFLTISMLCNNMPFAFPLNSLGTKIMVELCLIYL